MNPGSNSRCRSARKRSVEHYIRPFLFENSRMRMLSGPSRNCSLPPALPYPRLTPRCREIALHPTPGYGDISRSACLRRQRLRERKLLEATSPLSASLHLGTTTLPTDTPLSPGELMERVPLFRWLTMLIHRAPPLWHPATRVP